MKHFLELIANPDVLALAAAVAALFLAKSKFFTERDFKRARQLLEMGYTIAQISGMTRLKAKQIRTAMGKPENPWKEKAHQLFRGWF